ncbi:casein kinase II, regulatory subunit [Mycena leptocephala]|nr:casein kinase II, regulatory subunit [Mycena leptocephala]
MSDVPEYLRRPSVEDVSTDADSDRSISTNLYFSWISWFLSLKGNEYFCEIDEDFIRDSFNLTGLDAEVANYDQALDVLTDRLGAPATTMSSRRCLDTHARLLYGLIHARWILTAGGLEKMVAKYMCCDFGRCPRVFCHSHPLLPVGLVDVPFEKASRHGSIDGAHFGTTFPHLFYLVYPRLCAAGVVAADTPTRVGTLDASSGLGDAGRSYGELLARIYGFKLNETARLRWQEETQSEI